MTEEKKTVTKLLVTQKDGTEERWLFDGKCSNTVSNDIEMFIASDHNHCVFRPQGSFVIITKGFLIDSAITVVDVEVRKDF